ncbi:MAG: undecaprenyl-diphosphatase [Candidatus Marinimicrobia bacterium]|nr:undecaprenyl-diphosphatase [Candidatus Neomarinimicrobiota bacterium]
MQSIINRLIIFDTYHFHAIFRYYQQSFLRMLIYVITKSGDGVSYILYFLIIYLTEPQVFLLFLKLMFVGFCLEFPLYKLFKNSIKRRRPINTFSHVISLVKPSDTFSFPSGHTATAFMTAYLLSVLFPFITLGAFLWATLVGFSRVYLGVHYPGDILAGAFLGTGAAVISVRLLEMTGWIV